MVPYILRYFLQLVGYTLGAIVMCGLAVWVCQTLFIRLLGGQGSRIVIATSVIGTPVHELGHALMCILFRSPHHRDPPLAAQESRRHAGLCLPHLQSIQCISATGQHLHRLRPHFQRPDSTGSVPALCLSCCSGGLHRHGDLDAGYLHYRTGITGCRRTDRPRYGGGVFKRRLPCLGTGDPCDRDAQCIPAHQPQSRGYA